MNNDNNQNAADAITTAIGSIIDYPKLAKLIAHELRTETAQPHPDTPIEVAAIRRQLGRRNRPMAHETFNKTFIRTGLLQYIPGPNKNKTYVRYGDWERLKNEH